LNPEHITYINTDPANRRTFCGLAALDFATKSTAQLLGRLCWRSRRR